MADDWRIRIDVADERSEGLLDRLGLDLSSEARDLATHLEGRRLVVSRDGETIFVYAGSAEEAKRARAVVEAELRDAAVAATVTEPERWLAEEDRWSGEPAADFEPETEVRSHGHAPWEVRLDARTPDAARELEKRLAGDGYGVTRRHRYVLVGAATEDEARELAAQLHGEVEGSGDLVYEALPQNPFAIFGGLGGSGTPL